MNTKTVSNAIGQETLGTRIRKLRKRAGFTQEDIAHKIGVSRSLVAHWETDRPGNVFDHLPQLAEIMGIKLEEFLSRLPNKVIEGVDGEEAYILEAYRHAGTEERLRFQRFIQRILAGHSIENE